MSIINYVVKMFDERNYFKTILCLSLVAHMIVFCALLATHGPYSFFLSTDGTVHDNDTQHYVTIAKNLVEGHGYSRFAEAPFEPDALRTPLLPLYFVPFVYFGGLQAIWLAILSLNIILAFAPIFLYKLARLFMGHTGAIVAALAMTFEPLYLYRSQIAEPDALFVELLLLAMYFLARSWKDLQEDSSRSKGNLYAAFAVLGISILAKPSALYVAVIVAVFQFVFIAFFARKKLLENLKTTVISLLLLFAIVSPWLIRNHQVFGIWGVSSVSAYNLYQYYTSGIRLPGETVPAYMSEISREPSRYLPFQRYFVGIAMQRIAHAPAAYAREQAMGTVRNLFVSDLPAIYYYGHSDILPFSYNPESKTNIHELLSRGYWIGLVQAVLKDIPKLMGALLLLVMYCLAIVGWFMSWKQSRGFFVSFTLFLALFGYFLISSGPFVDAKYRLPAIPLVVIIATYGIIKLRIKQRIFHH